MRKPLAILTTYYSVLNLNNSDYSNLSLLESCKPCPKQDSVVVWNAGTLRMAWEVQPV